MPRRFLAVLASLTLAGTCGPRLAHAQGPRLTLAAPEPETSSRFGESVVGVPDLDGDGRGDLAVAAPLDGAVFAGQGAVYVLSGASGALRHTLRSGLPEANGQFGSALAAVPDLDGDGIADLVVGAITEDVTFRDTVRNAAGRAYVFSGATGAPLHVLRADVPRSGAHFGGAVAGVPDLDGDGRGDVLVGARSDDARANAGGRVYVYSGASGALLHTLDSPAPAFNGRFGSSVAGLGDLDGDGRGDVAVGAFAEDVFVNGGTLQRADAGRVHVFSGATGTLLRTLVSPLPERLAFFGAAVAALPDTDGDGVDDLAVAANYEASGAVADAGRVHVFSGASGAVLRTLVSPSPTSTGHFGLGLAGVPDVDGDGRGDVLAGAYPEAGFDGRAYLFSGATGARLATFQPPVAGDAGHFGTSVAGVPDFDGDGRPDVLVGAPSARSDEGSRVGRAYVFSGTAVETSADAPANRTRGALRVAPNPVHTTGRLTYGLDRPGRVRVTLHDALGRTVAVLVDAAAHGEGEHDVGVDVASLAPGLYLARLVTDDRVETVAVVVHR